MITELLFFSAAEFLNPLRQSVIHKDGQGRQSDLEGQLLHKTTGIIYIVVVVGDEKGGCYCNIRYLVLIAP